MIDERDYRRFRPPPDAPQRAGAGRAGGDRRRRASIAATQAAANVFREVLTSGPLLRTELTWRTGLSQPTITRITRSLIAEGYLIEVPAAGQPRAPHQTGAGQGTPEQGGAGPGGGGQGVPGPAGVGQDVPGRAGVGPGGAGPGGGGQGVPGPGGDRPNRAGAGGVGAGGAGAARGAGRVGRPATPLDVRADREFFIGVKVTRDELVGVVTDLRARVLAARHEPLAGHPPRVRNEPWTRRESLAGDPPLAGDPSLAGHPPLAGDPSLAGHPPLAGDLSPAGHPPQVVVAAIKRLVTKLRATSAETRERGHDLGVSIAGDVDRLRGVARYEPFHGWRDVPLAAMVAKATGLHTVVDNDIRALTEAENWFGAGARAESFLLVAIGSGVTCGLVVDGRVRAGAYGVAGELGHVAVDATGPACYCGARGCLEAVASEPAIVRRAAEITGDPGTTLAQAIDLARAGNRELGLVFARAGRAIGRAVGSVVNLVGPELVVVSANEQKGFDLLEGQLRAGIAQQAYGEAGRVEIFVRRLPFEEWARGAATVAIARRVTAVTGRAAPAR